MGGEGPTGTLRRALILLALSSLLAALSLASTRVPIENYLSEYAFWSTEPWYVPWRGAVVSLAAWVVLACLTGRRPEITRPLTWVAYALFAAFHYYSLYVVTQSGYSVSPLPLFYELVPPEGNPTLYLDLGQLLLFLTVWTTVDVKGAVLRRIRGESP